MHSETGKGRVLLDAKIIIWPTHAFCVEQIKTNVHENRIGWIFTSDCSLCLATARTEPAEKWVLATSARMTAGGGGAQGAVGAWVTLGKTGLGSA